MSDGMNKVILLGNLGTEPELRYTSGGTAVMHFRMATNESFLDRNRELTERTEWHSIVMFGSRAEGLSRVLTKGTCLLVEGTLRTSTYDKDGTKRYRTEVHARDVCFAHGAPRMPDLAPPVREPDESFVPVEMPPIPEDAPSMVMEERPSAASSNRPHRGRRAGGSAHRTATPPNTESYPF
jgi:single-strand DNA-binding protein